MGSGYDRSEEESSENEDFQFRVWSRGISNVLIRYSQIYLQLVITEIYNCIFNFHSCEYCYPAGQMDTNLKTDTQETVIHSPQHLTVCWTGSRVKFKSSNPFSDKYIPSA